MAHATESTVVIASAVTVIISGAEEAMAGLIMMPLTILALTTPSTTVPVTTLLTMSPTSTSATTSFSTIFQATT